MTEKNYLRGVIIVLFSGIIGLSFSIFTLYKQVNSAKPVDNTPIINTQEIIGSEIAYLKKELRAVKLEKDTLIKKLSIVEESLDPANTRWAKIKHVRGAVKTLLDKNRYPNEPNITDLTAYASAVVDYSELYDVDPKLILAITTRESAFNIKAVSHAGAKGLMQLMPGTAKECADDLNIRYYNIFSVNHNVRLGTWYLWRMLDTFDGNLDLAIRAYNCGPTCVKRVEGGEYKAYPAETAEYLEAVKGWMDYYKEAGL